MQDEDMINSGAVFTKNSKLQVFVDTVGDASKWQARLEDKYPGIRSEELDAC